MNYIVDIGHPGHVHLFKHTIKALQKKGHSVIITVKDIPVAKKLLEYEGLDYFDLGKKRDSIIGKLIGQLIFAYKILRIIKKNDIQVGFGTSITLPQAARFSKLKTIILDDDDDEVQPLFVKHGHPYCSVILTPDSIKRSTKQTINYPGIHELAYLHPRYFSPDENVLDEIGITKDQKFFILRFVAFKGHHDVGHSGISLSQKRQLIKLLETYGRVFITSEKEIEKELEKYRVPTTPEKMHSLMHFAAMFIGDSQTMATEAAVLGTPALKCNTFAGELSVPNEIEKKYDLCYSYQPKDFDALLKKCEELLNTNNLKESWLLKRKKLIDDKINLSDFLVWFIESYPNSQLELNSKPNFYDRFK
jgi:predicted glycosyltransferase